VLQPRCNLLRYSEYFFSSSLVYWVIASQAGITDLRSLLSLSLTNSAMMLLGYVIEKRFAEGASQGELLILSLTAWTMFLATWIPVLMSFFTSVTDNPETPPAVYSVVLVLFFLFASFGLLQVLYLGGLVKDYKQVELGYIVLSLVSKSLLAWIVWFGIKRPRSASEAIDST